MNAHPFTEPVGLRRAGSARARALWQEMADFLVEEVFPAEGIYERQREEAGNPHAVPSVIEELKRAARRRGLWNLFLSSESGLTQFEYAAIAELSGWSIHLAPEAINGWAPDSGNMELLHRFGTEMQKRAWLEPLLAGAIRSAFAMTEPDVASSDATNITTRIERAGEEYVVNGRKWWVSGAADERCEVLLVMGKTDPVAPRHQQQSVVIVPIDTPGVEVVRSLPVFGRQDQHGHSEIVFTDVRVPVGNLLGEEGAGFAVVQARLGPGRLHHAMRAVGAAERALHLLAQRAKQRVVFGRAVAEHGMLHRQIAEARIAIDQARLLCEQAAHLIDEGGGKEGAALVSMAKVAAPRAALTAIDAAIQVHGAAGVSDDTPLAMLWGWHRAMRIFDGPDETHLRSIARAELRRHPLPEGQEPPDAEASLPLPILRAFLSGRGVTTDRPLSARLISGGKSNLTFRVTDDRQRWILRRPPLGDLLPGAHDVAREHRVLTALRNSGVPVPNTVALCEDRGLIGAAFYVMDDVPGRVIRTPADAHALTREERRRVGFALVDVLADLHSLDPASVGLAGLGRPHGYLERQIRRWVAQLQTVQTRDLGYGQEIARELARTIPASSGVSLIHGDYRLDNVLVDASDPARIAAVLDWELATLGDPLADLATLAMFWDEPGRPFNPITRGLMAVEGFPSRTEAIDRYLAHRRIDLAEFGWYLAFAEFRLAVILEQIVARHARGETRGEGFEGTEGMVVELFDSAAQRCGIRLEKS